MVSMSSFNRVVLLGNLTRAPELRYLPGGETAVVEVLDLNGGRRVIALWLDQGQRVLDGVLRDPDLPGDAHGILDAELPPGSTLARLELDGSAQDLFELPGRQSALIAVAHGAKIAATAIRAAVEASWPRASHPRAPRPPAAR